MTRDEILQSGLLELYVAGALTPEDASRVESWITSDSLIAAEVQRIAEAVEAVATTHRAPAPADMKLRILTQIDRVEDASAARITSESENRPTERRRSQRPAVRRWLVAAAFVIGFLPSIWFYVQWQQSTEQLTTTERALASEREARSTMARTAETIERTMARLSDTNVVRTPLRGTAAAPSSFAVVFYDRTTNDVFLDTKSLPALGSNEDYQLWALVDGKPVDLGTFDPAEGLDSAVVRQMRAVQGAGAFAVTIEPQGGRPTPTLERMVVLGVAS